MSFFDFGVTCGSNQLFRKFLEDNALVPLQLKCPECSCDMRCVPDQGFFARFRCRKSSLHANNKTVNISGVKGTIFDKSKMPPQQIMYLAFCFVKKQTYDEAIVNCSLYGSTLSSRTVSNWYSCFREVCLNALETASSNANGLIGGVGKIVEIDETKVGKRKYNKGRIVDGVWVFGMIEREGGEYRLEVCEHNKRDRATLLRYIHQHVAPGSTIISDEWRAYSTLQQEGFNHQTVNHSLHFVDPETGAHTQNIESSWRALKRRICRGGVPKASLHLHFAEYLFFYCSRRQGRDGWAEFCGEVARQFPGYNG